jgi:hypothetical protein
MMEDDEMIYTAIFQNSKGVLTRGRYTGSPDRHQAWQHAAQMGEPSGDCLVAMVPGDHPLYTYENICDRTANIELKSHDVYEVGIGGNVFQMT